MNLMHTAHVPAGEGPFPTILTLHGLGANAHDLLGLAPYLHGGEALVLCPQAPIPVEVGPGMQGYSWFPITGGGPLDGAGFERGRQQLASWLDGALDHYPIDRRRLAVLGFSQGGVMAYDLALRDPARFSALIALSSWLPHEVHAGIEHRDEHDALPVMICHGTEDPKIPVARARDSRDRLRTLGIDATYREYEMQHEIRPEALRDIVQWIEDRVFPTLSA